MTIPTKLFPSIHLFFIITLLTGFVQASSRNYQLRHRLQHGATGIKMSKLFVFGDSYADTGNTPKNIASSWRQPYGVTFPGKPSGRFSDGRVLTDYIASFIKIDTPTAYVGGNFGTGTTKNGMNFAFGGTGALDTHIFGPNITTQINTLKKLLNDGVYSKSDLDSSMALLVVAGNDYTNYFKNNGSIQGLFTFIPTLVNQIGMDLKAIRELGIRKVAITSLQPIGCLPSTIGSAANCSDLINTIPGVHNNLLQKTVTKLNKETTNSPFQILDLYNAFMSAFKSQGDHPGNIKFEAPYKSCCVGVSSEFSCGSVDGSGKKQYTLCSDPKSSFFWDDLHPTDEGWRVVSLFFQATLHQL